MRYGASALRYYYYCLVDIVERLILCYVVDADEAPTEYNIMNR